MVWVLIQPGAFGDFFPDGTFVGAEERLTEYFLQMPDAFKAKYRNSIATYSRCVGDKWLEEVGTRIGSDPVITRLEDHEKPHTFQTVKTYKSLASLIKTENRLLAVDQALKDILERLEPGIHDFWPIKIVMPKGVVYPKPYYGIVIGHFRDSFVPEKSDEGSYSKEKNYDSYFLERSKKSAGVSFSKSIFDDSHLWRERRLRGDNILFSDTLQAEIAKAGLRIPKQFRAKEVA